MIYLCPTGFCDCVECNYFKENKWRKKNEWARI